MFVSRPLLALDVSVKIVGFPRTTQFARMLNSFRAKRLAEYQDMQRRNRPKRRLNEDLTDEEQPRRSPTPPLTHSSSGYALPHVLAIRCKQ